MTIAFWCVFIASFLPIMWQAFAKFSIISRFDNARPRVSLKTCDGPGQRASWAHDNSWEAFAPFAAAVIIGHVLEVSQSFLDSASIVFIVMRVAYGFCYVFDKSTLRSIVWFVAFCSVVSIYFAAAGMIG